MGRPGWIPPRSFFYLVEQRRLLGRLRWRWATLLGPLLVILLSQLAYLQWGRPAAEPVRIRASSGLNQESTFVYFYYHLGLYPVVSERQDEFIAYNKELGLSPVQAPAGASLVEDSRAGAEREFAEFGKHLLSDVGYTVRYGDLGKMYLFMPKAWWTGGTANPSVKPTHIVAFIFSLLLLYIACWYVRQPTLGLLLTLLMGANPLQLFEVYHNENVFSWPITVAIIILALHVPICGLRKPRRIALIVTPIVAGLLLATVRQIRSEPAAVAAMLPLIYLCVPRIRWSSRFAMIGLFVVTFIIGSMGYVSYFQGKISEANARITAVGGFPYPGPRDFHHMFWHPIWAGLGDFDRKYGYQWEDSAAADYARPILEARYGVQLPKEIDGQIYGLYWSARQKYQRLPYEIPQYGAVIRGKVLQDIGGDPLWYLGILARRLARIATQTSPVRLGFGPWSVPLPFTGWLLLPVALALLWSRSWLPAKMVLLVLPTSLVAFIVYSGKGTPLYSCYHIVLAALVACWAFEAVLWWRKDNRRARKFVPMPSGGEAENVGIGGTFEPEHRAQADS